VIQIYSNVRRNRTNTRLRRKTQKGNRRRETARKNLEVARKKKIELLQRGKEAQLFESDDSSSDESSSDEEIIIRPKKSKSKKIKKGKGGDDLSNKVDHLSGIVGKLIDLQEKSKKKKPQVKKKIVYLQTPPTKPQPVNTSNDKLIEEFRRKIINT
jgi:hypothetical protein